MVRVVKFNVWHIALPAGKVTETEPPIEGAVRAGEIRYDDEFGAGSIPLWEIDVPDLEALVRIVHEHGGTAEIATKDNEYPHPELIFP